MAAIASRMSCARSRHSLGDTDGLVEDLLPQGRVEGVGGSEVYWPTQEFAQPPLEANERKEADPCGRLKVHEQVNIARAVGFSLQRRAEQAKLPHREVLQNVAVGEQGAGYVRSIHGGILPEAVPGVKTHCAGHLPSQAANLPILCSSGHGAPPDTISPPGDAVNSISYYSTTSRFVQEYVATYDQWCQPRLRQALPAPLRCAPPPSIA